jgi:hypothetical protein
MLAGFYGTFRKYPVFIDVYFKRFEAEVTSWAIVSFSRHHLFYP